MKKNGFGSCQHEPGQFIKCLLMMKFTILLVFVFSLQSFGNGYGQDNISLNLEKVTFKKVFKAIEQQGVFRFVYKDEILPRDQRVSIAIENASLEDVLNHILRNTELSFRRLNGSLVVITTAEEKPVISITGKVTDEKGEPLPGVNIVEKGTNSGTTTNNEGIFVINVEKPEAILVFTYIGFLSSEVEVANRSSINVQLTPANKNMQEVVVVGYGDSVRCGIS